MQRENQRLQQLQDENIRLKKRLADTENALEAFALGEADAVVSSKSVHLSPQSLQVYRLFVDEMIAGAVTLDSDGRITYANNSFSLITGYRRRELLGKPFVTFFDETMQDQLGQLIQHLDTNEIIRDVPFLPGVHEGFPVQLNLIPIVSRDVRIVCVTVRDVSSERKHQQLITDREERFRSIVGQSEEGIVIMTPQGAVTEWNGAAERIFNIPRDSVVGRRINRLDQVLSLKNTRHEDELFETFLHVDSLYRALEKDEKLTIELEVHDEDENSATIESVIIEALAFLIKSSGHALIVIMVRDITERHRAAEQTRFHASLLAAEGQSVVATDLEGRVVYGNRAAQLMFYLTEDDLSSRKLRDVLFAGVDRSDGEELPFPSDPETRWAGELLVCPSPGRDMTVHISMSPFFGDDGRVAGRISVVTDISGWIQTRHALKEREQRYRDFFEGDVAGNVIAKRNGEVISFNTAFAGIFGFDPQTPPEKLDLSVLYEDEESRNRFMREIEESGALINHERTFRQVGGADKHVLLNVFGVYDSGGKLESVRAHVVDLTEKKKLEKQLVFSEKMEAIGRLAGGVAHDFNNMLMVMKGFTQLLNRPDLALEKKTSYLSEMNKAIDRATSLTRQLLAVGRKQEVTPEQLDLNTAIKDNEKMLRQLVPENIELKIRLNGTPLPVFIDRTQLSQVLLNLGTNARDAMSLGESKGGTLTISTELSQSIGSHHGRPVYVRGGAYACVCVTDTGVGMEQEVMEKVFDSFFTTKKSGTGLGLASVYGIVKQAEGYVFCDSEVGVGTTFTLYVPIREGGFVRERRSSETGGKMIRPVTVLLIDDEEMVRSVLKQVLEDEGHTVKIAKDGEEGIAMVAKEAKSFDLVITDMIMPRLDGRGFVRRLSEEGYSHIPVIVMSGYSDGNVSNFPEVENEWRYLEKPVDEGRLFSLMAELIRHGTSREGE